LFKRGDVMRHSSFPGGPWLALTVLLAALVGVSDARLGDGQTSGVAVASNSGQLSGPEAELPIYQSPVFGYSVRLPEGWRHSTKLSRVIPGGAGDLLGYDEFTIRTPDDEDAEIAAQNPRAFFWTARVEVHANPKGLTAWQWVRAEKMFAVGQRLDSVRLAGRPAVKKSYGGLYAFAYYVPDKSNMFIVGSIYSSSDRPVGASEADLQSILDSFRFTS